MGTYTGVVPIDTYVFGALPEVSTTVSKLHLLGRAGVTTIGSLSVAFFMEDESVASEGAIGEKRIREEDKEFLALIDTLKQRTEPCDVLVTSVWPSKVLFQLK